MTRISSTILGFGLAGVLGAAVAVLAMSAGADEAPGAKFDDSRISAQMEQLSARLDVLSERLEVIEKAPPMVGGSQAVAPTPFIPSGEDADPLAAQPMPNDFDERVAEAVKKNASTQMEQMGNRFASMAKQRESRALDSMVSDHGLNDWQRSEMERILEKRREVIGNFFRTMFSGNSEEPVDMAKMREEAEKVRAESEEEIKTLLTQDQYKAYEESGLNRRGGGGPFGGGRGGGGGGGR